jgi:hypothetical protein
MSLEQGQRLRVANHVHKLCTFGLLSGLSYEEGLIAARVLVELMEVINKTPDVDEDALISHIESLIDRCSNE